jgi:hypothetical protein
MVVADNRKLLIMIVSRGTKTIPVRIPMAGYEQCMAAGAEAESIAAKLKGTKLTWSCESEG